MTSADLIALAERCEQATGPDRELDIAILIHPAIGYRDVHKDGRMFDRGNDGYWWVDDCEMRQLPSPTASLDAAMTLVPRGWLVTIQRGFDDDGEYFSHVELTDSFSVGRGHDLEDEVTVTARQGARAAFHDPTALALCAAIRAALEEKPCPNCHGTGAVDYDPNQEIEPWME